jgi:PIN domain nuclease of toxin-antitoxin system
VKLLLDTHVVLWCLADDTRLKPDTRDLIRDPENAVFVSAASVWEMAIKRALGRIEIDLTQLDGALDAMGFAQLAITSRHARGVGELPGHHNDPFDRMLVSQSIHESMRLVTHDAALAQYGTAILV